MALLARAGATLLLVTAMSNPRTCGATTVEQMTLAEICDHAEMIVEGRVLSAQSYIEPGGRIATRVRMAVTDRLKGDAGRELTLRFAGGTVDGMTLKVADMVVPRPGETGIYFIEDSHGRQVHPLVGWSQGHFVERRDARSGRPGVFTPDGKRVLDVGPDAPLIRKRDLQGGTGAMFEAEVETLDSGHAAMSPAALKERVRSRLAASGSAR
jgi:hypothetical protein